jgi:hypothetical protein
VDGNGDCRSAGSTHLPFTINKGFIMNRKLAATLVFAAAAIAGNAFADDITVDNSHFVSSKSRAEVQAQLAQRTANVWSTQYNPLATFKSEKSREEVRAEYLASRNEVAAFNSEDSGSAYLAQNRVRNAGTFLAGQPQTNAQ